MDLNILSLAPLPLKLEKYIFDSDEPDYDNSEDDKDQIIVTSSSTVFSEDAFILIQVDHV